MGKKDTIHDRFSGVSAYFVVGQFVGTGVLGVLTWDAVHFDTDIYITLPSSVFTLPVDGFYRITTNHWWNFATGGVASFTLVTGAFLTDHKGYEIRSSDLGGTVGTGSVITELPAGTAVTNWVLQNSGAPRFMAGTEFRTRFQIELLS